MVDLIDHFGANFVIYVMAMVEVGAIAWIYGINNFCNDIYFMLGIRIGWYWKFCWGFFIPVGLFGILVYTIVTEGEFKSGDVSYPPIAIGKLSNLLFALYKSPTNFGVKTQSSFHVLTTTGTKLHLRLLGIL